MTQNPLDVPETVLGQLGNRVQHALRAFTPRDQRAVKTAAETFRQNPKLDAEKVITELGVGEALVSFLDGKGTPTVVERAFVYPPCSRLAPLSSEEREEVVRASPAYGAYEKVVDRESAHEILQARAQEMAAQAPPPAQRTRPAPPSQTEKILHAAMTSAARTVGTTVTRELLRGVLGGLFGGRGRRR